MAYVTSWERIALKKGRAVGIAEGKAVGIAKGEAKGKQDTLQQILMIKFGQLPDWVSRKIHDANEDAIEAWVRRTMEKDNLEDIFGPQPV